MNLKSLPTEELVGALVAGCAITAGLISNADINNEVEAELIYIHIEAIKDLTEEFESRYCFNHIHLLTVSKALDKVTDAIACIPGIPTSLLEKILNTKTT